MLPHTTICLLPLFLIGSAYAAPPTDDLLDQYVHYLGEESGSASNQRVRRDTPMQWTHSETLDGNGNVVLRWQPRHKEILFRIEAKTKGYVAIGFSPDGKKEQADMVIGWVDDYTGQAFLLDCHGVPDSEGSDPVKDTIDNYTLMKGIQNDSHTILEFRRLLDTCDPNDYVLTADTVVVIWAYHDNDPHLGAEMIYHGENRGAQSLHLLAPPPVPQSTDENIRQWDVTLKNFEVINNMNTLYWCKIFRAPTLQHKHHVTGYEPIIGPNHTHFVHHMILHECELSADDSASQWERFAKDGGVWCYGRDMPVVWEKCQTPLVAWAIGSKGENLPHNVGLPLGGKQKYYMLEVHFDNPSLRHAKDTTGLRLHYSGELRQHEAGILSTGVALSNLHFIPPHQREYKTAGYCSMGCTRKSFPRTGIHVVSVMLHAHLAGRKMQVRHLRGGKELPPLAADANYDFNYQQARVLEQHALILPGDGLITECAYSTIGRTKPTLGGYSTKEEMCLAFVLYYPRTELSGCYSMSPIKYFFETLGVREFYGKTMTDIENMFLHGVSETPVVPPTPTKPLFSYQPGDELSPEANRKAILALLNAKDYTIEGESNEGQTIFDKLVIKEPQEFQNKTFMNHLQNIPYEEVLLTKKIEEYFYTGLHLTFCRKRDDTLAIKEDIVPLPNFTAYTDLEEQTMCSYKMKRSPNVGSYSTTIPNYLIPVLVLSVVFLSNSILST